MCVCVCGFGEEGARCRRAVGSGALPSSRRHGPLAAELHRSRLIGAEAVALERHLQYSQ